MTLERYLPFLGIATTGSINGSTDKGIPYGMKQSYKHYKMTGFITRKNRMKMAKKSRRINRAK